jgi:RNA polymerase sigma-70 factor (sigma-E family)
VTFDEFAAARLPALLRYAVFLAGDRHPAEDLVQETMVKVYTHWRRVARADSPELYVRRMLTNTYLTWRRSSWLRRAVPYAEVPDPGISDGTEAGAVRQELWVRLGALPPRQRAAVVLRFYEGLPDAEIAEVLGCAVGTVRSLISRALTSLREVMGVSAVRDTTGGQA